MERSRGEKGRHWQDWHDAFPQVPQSTDTAKCRTFLSASPLRFQRQFYFFPLHFAIGHTLLSPGIFTVSTAAGTGGSCSAQQLCHPLGHGRDVQGGFWLPPASLGMPSADLPCLQFGAPGEGWQTEAVRWAQAPCHRRALHRRATTVPEPPGAGSARGSSSSGADVMCV